MQRSARDDDGAADQQPASTPPPAAEWTEPSRDERDTGWGEDTAAGDRDDDWYERERPPHH